MGRHRGTAHKLKWHQAHLLKIQRGNGITEGNPSLCAEQQMLKGRVIVFCFCGVGVFCFFLADRSVHVHLEAALPPSGKSGRCKNSTTSSGVMDKSRGQDHLRFK